MNAVAVNSMPSITMLKFQHLQAAIAGTHAQACPRTSLDRKLGINMISSARSPPPWPVRGLHPCSLQPLARGITSVILSQQALTPTSVDAVAAAPWHLTDTPRGLPVQGSTRLLISYKNNVKTIYKSYKSDDPRATKHTTTTTATASRIRS